MGTQEEEAAALDRIHQEAVAREAAAIKAAEDAAKASGQSSMVAAEPQTTGQGWPDNEVQAAPGKLSQAAGALGVGQAGDVAFAKKLLDSERGGSASDQAGQRPDGAKDGAKGRATGGLGVQAAKPAFER